MHFSSENMWLDWGSQTIGWFPHHSNTVRFLPLTLRKLTGRSGWVLISCESFPAGCSESERLLGVGKPGGEPREGLERLEKDRWRQGRKKTGEQRWFKTREAERARCCEKMKDKAKRQCPQVQGSLLGEQRGRMCQKWERKGIGMSTHRRQSARTDCSHAASPW